MRKLNVSLIAISFVFCGIGALASSDHPYQISSASGDSTVYFGVLAQAQSEQIRTTTGMGDSQDLFLRRLRILAFGKINNKLSFFIETDNPNLGKATAAGSKVDERMFVQDAILTYAFRPEFQIDAGMLLLALSHNSCQSAAAHLAIDYGPYTFVSSDPTGSRAGRDYGVQARGYLFKDHVEYRAGIFQGSRATLSEGNPGQINEFRYSGRVVWYPFEPETGFFYTGTSLGTKKILSVGAAFDHQMKYDLRSVDFFYDQPLGRGDGVTFQGGYTYIDGESTFASLPKEHIWLAEAGYYHKRSKLGPFIQLSDRLYADPLRSDAKKYVVGIAYWASAHRFNLKFGVGRSLGSPGSEAWQFVLQGQAFIF